MASNEQHTAQNPSTPPRRAGANRGRHRGHTASPNIGGFDRSPRGGRNAGPGGRGRGGRGRGQGQNFDSQLTAGGSSAQETTREPRPPSQPGGGVSSAPPVESAAGALSEVNGKKHAEESEDGEAEVCFICASPVVHNSVAPCNHRTCHICSLRLRALYKTKTCAHCRTPSDFVIFTDTGKRYEEFSRQDVFRVDHGLGIQYEKPEIFEDTLLLLRYNCPDPDCDVACLGWPDLHRHVKSTHAKVMCDLCTRNKKVFTHEHELFTPAELRKHEKFGDDNPGAIDQTGFKGHPECGFCRRRFYGEDELYAHCREKHERCHICDRRNQSSSPVYWLNYDALEKHFRKDHFLCLDKDCLEKKFVVFESEMDLQAHQLEAHPGGLTRDARRVDMSSFSYRDSYVPGRRGTEYQERQDRGGRGRGRGRDPNAEALPGSSAQPLRRDELAFQRQIAIQTAHSVTPRTFGGHLSAPAADSSFTTRPTNERVVAPPANTQSTQAGDFPSLAPLNPALGGQSESTPQLTPAEEARRLRHNAVIERAGVMLRHDGKKLEEFRAKVSSFRNSAISASELIEAFFSLFDSSSADLGKLVKELADIFEIPAKRDELLKAWNDWKAVNEDYPSLPGSSSGSASVVGASHGGKRVLKLKSSTAQSSRSAVSRTGSWGTTNVNNLFPPLSAALASANRAGPGRTGTTPWAAPSSVPQALQQQQTRPPQRGSTPALSNAEAFPALPAAPKPTSTAFRPGYTGSGVRRDHGTRSPVVNAWSAPPVPSPDHAATDTPESDISSSQRKKGNKNKKQTLIHFG